jgi:hypothetical protein
MAAARHSGIETARGILARILANERKKQQKKQ